jgi:hypothetical protein
MLPCSPHLGEKVKQCYFCNTNTLEYLYILLVVGYKSIGASHGCYKGNPTEILQGFPTSSSGTGLWVYNPFNHETNSMEL